jgi:hypothetical protein
MIMAITAIVAAAALASVAFAVPQQAMAYRHHHNNNSIKVDQQVNQANFCSGQPLDHVTPEASAMTPQGSTVCLNVGSNSADIGH